MGQLKLEAAIKGYQIAVDVATQQAGVEDTDSARDSDTGGSQWVINLRSSVRPLITYSFFLIFVIAKLGSGTVIVLQSGLNAENIGTVTNSILDEPFMAIMSVLVGYYFGSRSVDRLTGKHK